MIAWIGKTQFWQTPAENFCAKTLKPSFCSKLEKSDWKYSNSLKFLFPQKFLLLDTWKSKIWQIYDRRFGSSIIPGNFSGWNYQNKDDLVFFLKRNSFLLKNLPAWTRKMQFWWPFPNPLCQKPDKFMSWLVRKWCKENFYPQNTTFSAKSFNPEP